MSPVWLAIYGACLAWSAWQPKDGFTWFLEVVPALIALAALLATRRRFAFTPLAYWLILAHCLILMVGGHYTYAEVPLFDWLREPMGWGRNHYDKLGHLAQGFVPAIVAREIILRRRLARDRRWANIFTVSICLAFSALYELIEWQVAIATGDSAEAFLGTQGYVWDTQSDMAFALLGAIAAIALLGALHDRQMSRCPTPAGDGA